MLPVGSPARSPGEGRNSAVGRQGTIDRRASLLLPKVTPGHDQPHGQYGAASLPGPCQDLMFLFSPSKCPRSNSTPPPERRRSALAR